MAKPRTSPAHTAGPWRLENHNEICAENKHESFIAEVFDETDQWRANARLIAAAPDLLSQLKSLVEDLKGGKELILSNTESDSWMVTEDGWDVLIESSEEVIRKAEGKA